MTVFWIAAAILTLAALTALILPLARRRSADDTLARADFDITVYKDQLLEIDRDLERGVLSDDQATAARTEIERRMLAAASDDETALIATGGRAPRWLMAVVLIVVPLGTVGLYMKLGQPTMKAQPFAEREQPKPGNMALRKEQVTQMITDMQARAKEDPSNPTTWAALGQVYSKLGRNAEAVQAYEQLVATTGRQAEALMALGEAMFIDAGEIVTPAAVKLFVEAKAKLPSHPMTYYYLGLERQKSGDAKGALAQYAGLLGISASDDEWVPEIQSRMKQLADKAGIDVPVVKLLPPAPAAPMASVTPGPTREQVQDAQDMAPADQQAMIKTMVARLAGKLKDNPDDLQGWKRLAQAYRVIGDAPGLAEAEAQIKRLEAR